MGLDSDWLRTAKSMECDLRKDKIKFSVMDKSVTEILSVKDSKHGKGLFATQNISKDFPLIKIKGEQLNFSDSLELGEKESYCLQVDIDKYIIPDEPFIFSNHSCDPNAGINNKLELVTLRTINAGEELTWDYSTSMLERHWTMQCECGSPFCRQIIADFDLLPKHLQNLYTHVGIVMPFITKYLRENTASLVLSKQK
jgi:SET domain-containing protein